MREPEPPKWNDDLNERYVYDVNESHELSESERLQLDFWADFGTYCDENQTFITKLKPKLLVHRHEEWGFLIPDQYNIGIVREGFYLVAIASFYNSDTGSWAAFDPNLLGELRAELYVEGDNAQFYLLELGDKRQEIESELGRTLVSCGISLWRSLDEVVYTHGNQRISMTEPNGQNVTHG